MPVVDLLWIQDIDPADGRYAEKQRLVDHFDRLYDVRGRRVRRDDARKYVRGDYIRLLLTLRWMLMDRRATSRTQVEKIADLYHGATPPARRWFKKFLSTLVEKGVVDNELMSQMTRRADRISL